MLDKACFNGVALILDITKRKEMESALKKSEEKYKNLVNCAPTAIYEIDFRVPSFKSVNESCCNLLNYSKEELMGMNPFAIFDGDSGKRFKDEIQKFLNKEETSKDIEYQVMDRNKQIKWVILNIKPIYKDNQLKSALIVGHDITERKQAENLKEKLLEGEQRFRVKLQASNDKLIATSNKLQQTNEELIDAQKSLEDLINELKISNKELEQFAYVASHDLQEPLRMISSFTQLLQQKYKNQLDTDTNEYMDFIVDGAQRMKKLIDDLLAFSRHNTETKKYDDVVMDVVMEDVLINLKKAITDSNAKVSHKNLPTIRGNSLQINQLLQNLVGNAIKFQRGKSPEIEITAHEFTDHWLFSVSDNGIGIDQKHQELIFNIFKRIHTRQEYEGSGIGLSICKKIVKRHGGTIWVESEPGQGSTFYFTISKKN